MDGQKIESRDKQYVTFDYRQHLLFRKVANIGQSEMVQQTYDKIRAQAANSVLESLGRGTYSLLNSYLMNTHEIFLHSPESYSMESLRKALDAFIGEKTAGVILELTFVKMEELAESNAGQTAEA